MCHSWRRVFSQECVPAHEETVRTLWPVSTCTRTLRTAFRTSLPSDALHLHGWGCKFEQVSYRSDRRGFVSSAFRRDALPPLCPMRQPLGSVLSSHSHLFLA